MNKWDQYVYSYVPKQALKIILEEGLYSGEALLKRPDLLELAAKSRKLSNSAFKTEIEKKLKDKQFKDSSLGPNVVFGLIPKSQELSKKHPTKIYNLVPIKINITQLLKDFPDTKIFGLELTPYVENKTTDDERSHYLNSKELSKFLSMSSKELWSAYDDIDDIGLYAPNVPHASIQCNNGIILAKYIQMIKSANRMLELCKYARII